MISRNLKIFKNYIYFSTRSNNVLVFILKTVEKLLIKKSKKGNLKIKLPILLIV